jgi:large repetitive protein
MAQNHAPVHDGPVMVRAGETRTVDLHLGSGGVLLSGRVLDVGGGVVVGAKVNATEATPVGNGPFRPQLLQTVTDDAGVYRLHLRPARYGLSAQAAGYAPANDWLFVARDTSRDLRLSPASRITGHVVERDGRRPVPDANVWISASRASFNRRREIKTDHEGAFTFLDLEPGTYRVSARKGSLVGAGASVSVALAQTVEDVEVPIDRGFVVSGRVTTTSGAAITGAQINLSMSRTPWDRAGSTRSASDGSYRIEGVLPAQYRLSTRADGQARDEQDVKVAADTRTDVTLAPAATLAGHVLTAQGLPAGRAEIQARVRGLAGKNSLQQAVSNPDGSFELKELSAGELTVVAQHREHGTRTLTGDRLAEGEQKQLAHRASRRRCHGLGDRQAGQWRSRRRGTGHGDAAGFDGAARRLSGRDRA